MTQSLSRLIASLKTLPGIGEKSAQRIARYILSLSAEDASEISQAILDARDRTRTCLRCGNLTEGELCGICNDGSRVQTEICVVEEPFDIVVIERAGVYRGLYHVLGGVISPLEDVSPDQLHIAELVERVARESTEEVILATSATTEGEATAMYVAGQLSELDVKVSRIARGIPVGADLGLADEVTISKALQGRERMEQEPSDQTPLEQDGN